MPSAEVFLTGIDDWDFDPPDWWVEAWYEGAEEIDGGELAQVDEKVAFLLSQEMPF